MILNFIISIPPQLVSVSKSISFILKFWYLDYTFDKLHRISVGSIFKYLKDMKSIFCWPPIPGYGTCFGLWWTSALTMEKNRTFFPQLVSIANIFLVSNGILCLFPFLGDFVCFKPVLKSRVTVRSPVSALLYLEDCFLEVILTSLAPTISQLFYIAP